MVISLILAALMIILGSQQNDLLILKIRKPVKKVVVDVDRKAEILSEIKAVKKLYKTYGKKTKDFTKQSEKLLIDQSTDRETFDSFYNSVVEYEIEVNKEFIPHRIRIQDNISQEEWEEILIAAAKAYKKQQKSGQKALTKLKKHLNKMRERMMNHVKDPGRREKAGVHLEEFSGLVYDFAIQIVEYDHFEEEILVNKNATEDELSSIVERTNKQWIKIFDALSILHAELAALVTADEWKSVARELKKLV